MSDVALRLEDVSLSFESDQRCVEVLQSLSFTVNGGRSLTLVGPSGSGKSSLLMLLAGLERPSSGQVEVLGRDLARLGEDELARLRRDHIGFVFQSFHLIPTMTALENVATALDLGNHADPHGAARQELAAVGLESRLNHHPTELSGGEQQRVAIARAVATAPNLILADEPTGNLDEATGSAVADLLFESAARSSATLILVTHNPALASRTERVLRLQAGRIVSDS